MSIAGFDSNKKKQGMKDNDSESEYIGIRILPNATNAQLAEIKQAGKIKIEYTDNDKTLSIELNVAYIEGIN